MEQALRIQRGSDDRTVCPVKVLYITGYPRRGVADFRGDIKRILNTSPGATAAIHLILRTKLLDQFKTTVCESHAESGRSAGKKRKGSEGHSSGIGVP